MTYPIILYMDEPAAASIEEMHHRGDEPHLLREILRTYQVLVAGSSRRIGMPASHFALLRLLAVSGPDLGVMDLARQLGVNAAAVTRQVQALEREGLVRRHADSRDRRRSYVSLSPKGRKLFGRIHDRIHEFERALSAVITGEEMAIATRALVKLREFVSGQR
jgi:MarR family transcriptional regulator for hemolysin